jgi:RNA polymerase sigma-70 factor, ECF subfamily
MIDEAVGRLRAAAKIGQSGPYQIMATIHAAYASRQETGTTPWPSILALYDALITVRPSPVVAINRAVALAEVCGPKEGLVALAQANGGGHLEYFAPYHVARAHLVEQVGDLAETRAALGYALDLITSPAEQSYLRAWVARLKA